MITPQPTAPNKKPRYSCTVRDRKTGQTVTLDYPTMTTLSTDFSTVLRALAAGIEREHRRTNLNRDPATTA